MPVEVVVTFTGSSVEDVLSQISDLRPAPEPAAGASASTGASQAPAASSEAPTAEPTPENPTTPPSETQQPPWARTG